MAKNAKKTPCGNGRGRWLEGDPLRHTVLLTRFARAVAFGLALAPLWLSFAAPQAQAQPIPLAGRDYVRIEPQRTVSSGDKIEVIEFFYYGCPICYELQPALTRWLFSAPEDVTLRRVPALISANWENLAKLFYTLEALEKMPQLHWPIYDSLHFDDVGLSKEAVMTEWAARNGIDRQEFIDTYRSPAIEAKVAGAREMTRAHAVKGVPSMVVDGKFLTSARMAGGTRELLLVVDKLVEQARKERAK